MKKLTLEEWLDKNNVHEECLSNEQLATLKSMFSYWVFGLYGKLKTNLYDNHGNLIMQIDSDGRVCQWQYEFDDSGNKTKAIDQYGRVWEYEYDKHGNKTKEVNPDGEVFLYTNKYYDDGQLKCIHIIDKKPTFITKIKKFILNTLKV